MSKMYEFYPRGIGNGSIACFVCGMGTGYGSERKPYQELQSKEEQEKASHQYSYGSCQADMASFVGSKEQGNEVAKMFKYFFLDYREYEPHRVQLKIGACPVHLVNLQRLLELTRGNRICQCIIDEAVNFNNKERANQIIEDYASEFIKDIQEAADKKDWSRVENRLKIFLLRTQEAL